MMLNEYDDVVLTIAVPAHGLEAGDIGTIVLIHQEGAAYEVEFMTLAGHTVAVVTLRADQVRPVQADEIAHARVVR
jgi:hypothetical protein